MGFLYTKGPAATTSAQALTNLQNYQGSMQSPEQQLQKEQQNLGTTAAQQQVTGLQQAISNTTNLLNNVAPSVYGRTGQSLETSAQANAEIANEQAPISQNLNTEQSNFDKANTNYTNLEQQAENLANADQTSQQNQLSYLNNIYQALYGQESSAAQAQQQQSQFEQSLAEQVREANLSASTSGTASPSFNSGGSTAGGAQMQLRSGGGYNFQGGNGQAISAAAYAQSKGIPFRTLLQNMANAGDQGAKTALDYVGNDYGINTQKVRTLEVDPTMYNNVVNTLNSLLWGVNRL